MRFLFLVLLALFVAGCVSSAPRSSPAAPAASWTISSPEAQGMNSDDLANALQFARTKKINIHSLTIVRNGVIVLDAYFYPYTSEMRHDLASATKSITSLLVGAAISDGRLEGTDQRIVSVLPFDAVLPHDTRVERIRIGDLLTMQSGFDCGFVPGELELAGMRRTQDWTYYVLHLPMVAEPGTRFGYCSPNYNLLSASITATTGLSEADYARKRLFSPLGIKDMYWPANEAGISHGWGDLQLKPRDMAKIGLLMLHRGRWEDRQLIAKSWIDDSLAPKVQESGRDPYGLGWWLSSQIPSLFEAQGRGGQRISVISNKNLVIVMTGGGFEPGDIGNFVLRALRSDHALPTNKAAETRLANELRAISAPEKATAFTLPAEAVRNSGRVYVLPDNRFRIKDFSVTFNHSAQATIRLGLITGETIVQPLGLDGVYRLKQDAHGAYSAGKAKWPSDRRLEIELNMLSRIDRLKFEVEFTGDVAHITVSEPTEIGTVILDGIAK